MEKSKRGLAFWVLLLVAVILPSSALATKQVYKASMWSGSAGRGSSVMNIRNGQYDYIARSTNLPDKQVQAVWLSGEAVDGNGATFSWMIPLCTNGGPTDDDCTYFGDAPADPRNENLDISGFVTPTMLMYATTVGRTDGGSGITGAQFFAALSEERMTLTYASGAAGTGETILATGVYDRIL